MNNNIKKAEKKINCFKKNNPNITYTCFVPSSATVTVGTTTTTAPGTNASVTNSGTKTNAILNFSIPRGEPGTPAGGITPAYSSIYSTANTQIALTQAQAAALSLITKGINNNVNNTTPSKLIITNSGDYKIDYFLASSPSVAATLTLDVRQNNNTISGSSISKSATQNETTTLQGTVLATLKQNDVIELYIASQVNANLTPADGTNAYLIITKLN